MPRHWMDNITDDVLSRARSAAAPMPTGTNWTPIPRSTSDLAAARPLPSVAPSSSMFVSTVQRADAGEPVVVGHLRAGK